MNVRDSAFRPVERRSVSQFNNPVDGATSRLHRVMNLCSTEEVPSRVYGSRSSRNEALVCL